MNLVKNKYQEDARDSKLHICLESETLFFINVLLSTSENIKKF